MWVPFLAVVGHPSGHSLWSLEMILMLPDPRRGPCPRKALPLELSRCWRLKPGGGCWGEGTSGLPGDSGQAMGTPSGTGELLAQDRSSWNFDKTRTSVSPTTLTPRLDPKQGVGISFWASWFFGQASAGKTPPCWSGSSGPGPCLRFPPRPMQTSSGASLRCSSCLCLGWG